MFQFLQGTWIWCLCMLDYNHLISQWIQYAGYRKSCPTTLHDHVQNWCSTHNDVCKLVDTF
jgi:hypothetical protein